MSRLDSATLDVLRQYRSDIERLPNEAARSHRFIALVERLFPGSPAAAEFADGIEKVVRIDVGAREKRGRIDAYHGNAVIEFERSLKAKESEARRQLREYAAGLWRDPSQRERPLLCIATDGVVWKTFHPELDRGAPHGSIDSVELGEPIRTLTVGEGGFEDFYHWLTRLLFRQGQIEPTAQHFRADFGASSPVYVDAMRRLRAAWSTVGSEPEPALAFATWRRYLTVTYGQLGDASESDLAELFLKHTYLVAVARLLCWAALSGGRTSRPLEVEADEAISGHYFRSIRIENLAENDFFQWIRLPAAAESLARVWERTIEELLAYDLDRLEQDVLKSLYQELVDPRDRHELGEYYTPDWLCEKMVAEVLPAGGYPSVLDPTCGSGSFLRAAIAHILASNRNDAGEIQLEAILENVVGIDIHPLAVTIARATYLVAIRGLLKSAGRPVRIPVYLADALFLPAEVQQLTLGARPSYEIRFGGDRRVALPEGFVKDAAAFDAGVTAASAVAGNLAADRRESPDSLRQRAGMAGFEASGRFDAAGRRVRSVVTGAGSRRTDPPAPELDLGVRHPE